MSHKHRGFMASGAILVLALGTLGFASTVLAASISYADISFRRELRLQSGLNAESCLVWLALAYKKDYFINGQVQVPQFGCVAGIENSEAGSVSIKVKATLSGVSSYSERMIYYES